MIRVLLAEQHRYRDAMSALNEEADLRLLTRELALRPGDQGEIAVLLGNRRLNAPDELRPLSKAINCPLDVALSGLERRRVGIEDAGYFARIFRRTYGVSPRTWPRARWSAVASSIVFFIIKYTVGLKVSLDVEEEGLDARIASGPIPLDEALPIARQIAEAHGVSPAVHAHAADRGLKTIDATCPLVTPRSRPTTGTWSRGEGTASTPRSAGPPTR